MPSDLPSIRIRTTEDNIAKFKFIALRNKRSMSKELEMLMEKHIAEFEEKHGTIDIRWLTPKEALEVAIEEHKIIQAEKKAEKEAKKKKKE